MVSKFFSIVLLAAINQAHAINTLNESEKFLNHDHSVGITQAHTLQSQSIVPSSHINTNRISEKNLQGSRYNTPRNTFNQTTVLLTQPFKSIYDITEDNDEPLPGESLPERDSEENNDGAMDVKFLDTANIFTQLSEVGSSTTDAI